MAQTGKSLLAEEDLLQGRFSSPVYGKLTAHEALRIMLAGSGLTVSFESEKSVALMLRPEAETAYTPEAAGTVPTTHPGFYRDLQRALKTALCEQSLTRPGDYEGILQLWFDNDGNVRAVHFAVPTGEENRDAGIAASVSRIRVQGIPAGLVQPLTIALNRNSNPAGECGTGLAARP